MNPGNTYIALLRGINVGGHHKVPMADVKDLLHTMKLAHVRTLLNSGNVIFESKEVTPVSNLENLMQEKLEEKFGFPIPTILCEREAIESLIQLDPFKNIEITKYTRLYISFLKEATDQTLETPWVFDDGTFRIITHTDKIICSVLDLSQTKTPKGMEALEKIFGKNITTRNWNTIVKIYEKLDR